MHCASLERPHHEKTRGRFSDDRERGSIVCRKHHLFAGILTFLPAAIVASDTPSRERGRRVRHAFADYHPRENFVKRQIPRSLMSRKSDLGVFFSRSTPLPLFKITSQLGLAIKNCANFVARLEELIGNFQSECQTQYAAAAANSCYSLHSHFCTRLS